MPASGSRATSTSRSGLARPRLIIGTRLCPPAIGRASPSLAVSASSASSSVSGRAYSNGRGYISDVPARVDDDVVPGDVAGAVGREEAHRLGDVHLVDEAPERGLRREVAVDLVVRPSRALRLRANDPVHPLAVGDVRTNRVDGDVVRP